VMNLKTHPSIFH